MHYITKINNASRKKIIFDSMGVTLIGMSSLHAAYSPGDYWYILVVIEIQGVELRKRLSLLY